MSHEFEITSELAASAEAVAAHCASPKGIAEELRPWFRMTFPRGLTELNEDTVRLGKPMFRSLILLFGVLPIDWDDVTIVELEPGRRFLERSSMASQRVWEHERIVVPVNSGTRITDRLRWEGRFPASAPMFDIVVPRLFRWRHRQLKRIFGVM